MTGAQTIVSSSMGFKKEINRKVRMSALEGTARWLRMLTGTATGAAISHQLIASRAKLQTRTVNALETGNKQT